MIRIVSTVPFRVALVAGALSRHGLAPGDGASGGAAALYLHFCRGCGAPPGGR